MSIVIPAYNERNLIDGCVKAVKVALNPKIGSYELILCTDGSTNGTDEVAAVMASENPRVVHLPSDERLGRGAALKRAFSRAKGETLMYLDADLPANLGSLHRLVRVAESSRGMATGSRHLKESRVKRPLLRWAASKVYNLLVRLAFRDGVLDHQCGFKAFHREFVDALLGEVEADGWFWDTEIIVRARRKGYPVIEIPVEWTETRVNGGSKVELLSDTLGFVKNLARLWWTLNIRNSGLRIQVPGL